MDIQKDFSDLCSLLNVHDVKYLIVGGYAVAFHGAPRFTGDLDIFVQPAIEQIRRMLHALRVFGFPADEVAASTMLEQGNILQLGRVPVQIHIMTAISGVDWGAAWESRTAGKCGDVDVYFIGRNALLANKRAAGRLKHLADVEALGEQP